MLRWKASNKNQRRKVQRLSQEINLHALIIHVANTQYTKLNLSVFCTHVYSRPVYSDGDALTERRQLMRMMSRQLQRTRLQQKQFPHKISLIPILNFKLLTFLYNY